MYFGVLADRLDQGTRRILLWTNLASSACMALFPLGYLLPHAWRLTFALVVFSVSSALKAPAYGLIDAYTLKYLEYVGAASDGKTHSVETLGGKNPGALYADLE
jgi:MFS family permease